MHVATFDGHVLRHAGAVGTGFSEAIAARLREKLGAIVTPQCAIAGLKGVAPDLRAQVAYRGATDRQRVAAREPQGAGGIAAS